ncbi:MAG: CHRD domain-containing protein [Gemmatimonadaceae bacterium]
MSREFVLFMTAALTLGASTACSSDDTTGPKDPASVVVVSGNGQQAQVGRTLTEPLIVEVRDDAGTPISGVTVTFAVTRGTATVSAATAQTDASGRASTTVTLGNDGGTVVVTATVRGGASTTFTVTATRETFSAVLNGAGERPIPAVTNGTGTAQFTVFGPVIQFQITHANLTTSVVGAHIHAPADVNTNAAVLVPFPVVAGAVQTTGSFSSTTNPNISLDSLKVLMRAGLAYVNIHTVTNPAGEIRGQIRTP